MTLLHINHPQASKVFQKKTFSQRCFWCLTRRLPAWDAGGELSSLSEQPVFHALGFSPTKSQRAGTTANRNMTGQPGLDGISLLPPKPYCSDKCYQYIDWMSKSWKTGFSCTTHSCHTRFLHSTFNSPTNPSPRLLTPLQISVTEAENTRFSRLDASTDRKSKVNWALRQDD